MDIKRGNFNDEQVKALLAYHLKGMHESSPPGHVFALDWSALQNPEISFYSGYVNDGLVVIGALKALGDGTGELKSMRVAEGQAGKGYGAALLVFLIGEARRRGYWRVSLETGSGAAFEAALALYQKHGFIEGEEFGGYSKTEFSRLFHLKLSNTPLR